MGSCVDVAPGGRTAGPDAEQLKLLRTSRTARAVLVDLMARERRHAVPRLRSLAAKVGVLG